MAVLKFRSVEEMDRVLSSRSAASYRRPGEGADLAHRIADLWSLSASLAPWRFPHGVWKFRSIELANRHREEWETERVRRLAEKRKAPATPRPG